MDVQQTTSDGVPGAGLWLISSHLRSLSRPVPTSLGADMLPKFRTAVGLLYLHTACPKRQPVHPLLPPVLLVPPMSLVCPPLAVP